MALVCDLAQARARGVLAGSACAFGVFDGVHAGHRRIIADVLADARARGGSAVALTFDRDPDELFAPGRLRKLMSNDARIAALSTIGVDAVVVLPFTPAFAALGPEEFLVETFGDAHPAAVHVGVDFRFGAQAAGDAAAMRAWGARTGMEVVAHELFSLDGVPVTSTRIRGLLAACDVSAAARLLTRPYALSGMVRHGRGEGRSMGVCTANVELPEQLRVLGDGVYAAYATVDGERFKAAVSMGVAVSFPGATDVCEVHLLDFDRDVYGARIKVEFAEYLRPMRKFDDVSELIATIKRDIDRTRAMLEL